MITIGLMSGTSLDGVDAVACEIKKSGATVSIKFLAHEKVSYTPSLRANLLAVSEGGGGPAEISSLNVKVGEAFARAAKKVIGSKPLAKKKIDIIGSHGQTIWHEPKKRSTLQIDDPSIIAAENGIAVWADFRSADLARGGQGAPLAPIIHVPLFSNKRKNVVVVNIGGIANLTYIPAGATEVGGVIAYDTGPGNMLIDYAAAQVGAKGGYDNGGRIAATGSVDTKLLKRLATHPYFKRRPPKSTGREVFGKSFFSWAKMDNPAYKFNENTLATLTELTAVSVVKEIEKTICQKGAPLEIILCGGGSRNTQMVRRIRSNVGSMATVVTSDEKGAPAQMVEGGLIALLAYYSEMGMPLDLSTITGALPGGTTLGARYPA